MPTMIGRSLDKIEIVVQRHRSGVYDARGIPLCPFSVMPILFVERSQKAGLCGPLAHDRLVGLPCRVSPSRYLPASER